MNEQQSHCNIAEHCWDVAWLAHRAMAGVTAMVMGVRTMNSALLHRKANTTALPPPAKVFCSHPSGGVSGDLAAAQLRL